MTKHILIQYNKDVIKERLQKRKSKNSDQRLEERGQKMFITLKQQKMIADYLKENFDYEVEITTPDEFDTESEYYESLMDEFKLCFDYKGGLHIEQL